MESIKKPDAAAKQQSGLSNISGNNDNKLPTKREVVLAWLIDESEKGSKVTRFDAEHIGDHCFNSSVSEIERLDGVKINRRPRKVKGRSTSPLLRGL